MIPFHSRHIGPSNQQIDHMLQALQVKSLTELADKVVPNDIRSSLKDFSAQSEQSYINRLRETAQKNSVFKSYIGCGYHPTIVPPVIQRNIFENPGWYTQYTPYQSEIAQGRLEALLNFQTLISDLTGLAVANASLLDEATAAAEAMAMSYRIMNRGNEAKNTFFVDNNVFPQTLAVLEGRAEPLGIELKIGEADSFEFDSSLFGALVQTPNQYGALLDVDQLIQRAKKHNILVTVVTDPMALVLLQSPGDMGADISVGSAQRFGVPMGFGGPHAGFFATKKEFQRFVPGRIIGVSKDRAGRTAFRMALQTREQHIRREKATSNICTAQALLAIMAGMYAVYHGPKGLEEIASHVHRQTLSLEIKLSELGFQQSNISFFDTLHFKLDPEISERIRSSAQQQGINFRFFEDHALSISLHEAVTSTDVDEIVSILKSARTSFEKITIKDFERIPAGWRRKNEILKHPVFQEHHSETKMMRYIKKLENRDLSLTRSMIPLGSCTMKLNASAELMPVSWPEFSDIHPFAPREQIQGYQEIFKELEADLAAITGLPGVSLQPNSGAQGELAGLLVIRAYHHDRGEKQRDKVLIPTSAHGTNPASATMAGMEIVLIKCDSHGNIDLKDLYDKSKTHRTSLAALMITYPSTHGVFEKNVREVCKIVHDHGGQIYMDGANMNAQVGLSNPAVIGADVCHLNLHKTFSIPHGGGGPGAGPICVANHLIPFLPGHPFSTAKKQKSIKPVAAAPFGSASILIISHAYIKLMGSKGLEKASQVAILNSNYIKKRLEKVFPVLYTDPDGWVAHELIIDLRPLKKFNIEAEDVAKRLVDYGFHSPTVSWPVLGTMMIEPTESEAQDELDRFCEAMISIRHEIEKIESGGWSDRQNPLKNAPHTAFELAKEWTYPYDRETAVFPVSFVKENKFWPPVNRVDNTFGDRNLICICPPIESYDNDK